MTPVVAWTRRLEDGLARALRAYVRFTPLNFGRATIAQFGMNRLLERERPVRLRTGGRLRVLGTGNGLDSYAYWFGLFEPTVTKLFHELLSKGDVVIDVGANIGYHTVVAAHCVGADGKVIAFEPLPSNFERLERNVALNRLGTVCECHRRAVGSTTQEVTLFEDAGGDHSQAGIVGTGQPFVTSMVRLDDVIPEVLWSRCRVLKIDVEGLEFDVLDGASELIARAARLVIVCEVSSSRTAAASVGTVDAARRIDDLRAAGFDVVTLHNDGSVYRHAHNGWEVGSYRGVVVDPLDVAIGRSLADQAEILRIGAG